MELTERQQKIIKIVQKQGPITGEKIASELGLSRSTLRPDFSLLTLSEFLIAKPKVGYFYNTNKVEPFVVTNISQKRVEEVMSVPVNIDQKTSIQDAISRIFLEDVGSLYITDNKKLVGLVSRKDLLKSVLGKSSTDKIPVSLAMTRMPNIVTIHHDDSVEYATRKLLAHQVDSLPVIKVSESTGTSTVVGKFSKTVISRLFLNVLENEF